MTRLLFALLTLFAGMFVAQASRACEPIEDAVVSSHAAMREPFAGKLVLKGPDGRSYVLEEPCYQLDQRWRRYRLSFLLNNHLGAQERKTNLEHDLAVQILKLSPRPDGAEPHHLVTAFRSDGGQWFRGTQPLPPYGNNNKKLGLSPNEWSEEHDAGGLRRHTRIDLVLGGPFHGQARPDSKPTFSYWWRLDSRLSDRYNVTLSNLLLKFEPPGSERAGGVPFNTSAKGYDAVVIRYNSFSSSISGDVKLCFADCDTFDSMRIESLTRGRLEALFRLFFPVLGEVQPTSLEFVGQTRSSQG